MERFAEVIVPLPLESTFTYSVPPELQDCLEEGARVFVSFGRQKYYTGIVAALHSQPPRGYEVKPIAALLDPRPAVRFPQIKFWRWVAEYYLCSIGEVMRAALPTGLKPESETLVSFNKDYEPASEEKALTEKENWIVTAVMDKRMKLSEIEKLTGLRNIGPAVNALLERGILQIDEKIADRYKPKRETLISLNAERGDRDKLHEYFGLVTRSPKQEKMLIRWLEMSDFLKHGELKPVLRKELIELSGCSTATLRALIDRGIFREDRREINRFNAPCKGGFAALPELSPAQSQAIKEISAQWRDHAVTLLHGVTGSGKTEIYSHLISKTLQSRNSVLYLVPEISLTTQLTDRLRRIFGDSLLVYHSKFSDNERVDIYRRVLSSREPLLILGARSSVFLPFNRLGLVIVDEEHESSFKQYDPAPRYNARDAAIMLATMHGAKTLLGSATPAVDTYFKATMGKFGLVELTERFDGATLPEIEIVDMRDQRKRKLNDGIISAPLKKEVRHALDAGKQVIMFQNRRGFAPMVVCRNCGWTPRCLYCDVSLVFHKSASLLRCHYCGHAMPKPALCPACGADAIEVFGHGTERIADEAHRIFEGARVARMDLDTTRAREAHQEIIDDFSKHETDILVGTQMVTKGLDFDDVNLVAALNADTLLNFPDFRSDERAFNMLTQAAGRAGRRKTPGKVIIQTSDPKNEVLGFIREHDYKGFYRNEIENRHKYAYPPFTKIITVCLKHRDPQALRQASARYAGELRRIFGSRVLGPQRPAVARVASWYVENIMLKIEANAAMAKVRAILRKVYADMVRQEVMRGVTVYYDVDPA